MDKKILYLDLRNFPLDEEVYKIPFLYETWTWEGDESVLPYKFTSLVRSSRLYGGQLDSESEFESFKKMLKEEYFGLKTFDKLSFFFITHRSDVTGCAYINNGIIDYFLVAEKHLKKGVENGLFSLVYNRAVKLGLTRLGIRLDLTNINEEFFRQIGFK